MNINYIPGSPKDGCRNPHIKSLVDIHERLCGNTAYTSLTPRTVPLKASHGFHIVMPILSCNQLELTESEARGHPKAKRVYTANIMATPLLYRKSPTHGIHRYVIIHNGYTSFV